MTFWDRLERELLYREIPSNRERCAVCGDSFWRWQLWQGVCGWCELESSEEAR